MHPFNRLLGTFGLSLSRVYAPAQTRSTPDPVIGEVVIGGRALMAPLEGHLVRTYQQNPSYMMELGRVAERVFVKYPNMIAVDVGANIGDTASIIRSGCAAPIICFEGDRTYESLLAENAARVGQTSVRHLYLSDDSGVQMAVVDKVGWNSTLLPAAGQGDGTPIEFLTLDEALSGDSPSRVKLLKVDTEGFDPKILRGARQLLHTSRPVVMFEHNRENLMSVGEDNLSAFVQLRQAGYNRLIVWDAFGRLMLTANLSETSLLEDLHGYVGFREVVLSRARYLDVCAFHEQDSDVAEECVTRERAARDGCSGL